jgi:protein TonB
MNLIQWLVASTFAFLLHITVFYALFSGPEFDDGAQGAGKNGIEFDLGMLGDMGESGQANRAKQAIDTATIKPVAPTLAPKHNTQLSTPLSPQSALKPTPKQKPQIEKVAAPTEKMVAHPIQPAPSTQAEIKRNLLTKVNSESKSKSKSEATPVNHVPTAMDAAATTDGSSSEKSSLFAQKTQHQITTGSGKTNHGGGNPDAKISYFAQLNAKLAQHKYYPNVSRRRQEEGVATVGFKAHPNGRVSHVRVIKSSGFRNLDKAVVDMVKRSLPLPAFSQGMAQTPIEVTIPIEFRLE